MERLLVCETDTERTRARRDGVSLTLEAKPWGVLTISTAGHGA